MAERAVFLDRDNTILEDREGYLGDPAKVKLLPGAATAIAALRRMGYRIIVASNQSGVARGMFDEAAVEAVNQEMCRQLREQAGAHVDASYYCPYHPEAVVPEYRMEHDWRKPKPGMIKQAGEDFGLDLGQSWMIGDSARDIAAGASAGCRTILIRNPEHPSPDGEGGGGGGGVDVSPNFIVKTLADAARIVSREGKNPHPDLVPVPLARQGDTPEAEVLAVAEAAAAKAAEVAQAVSLPTAPAARQPNPIDEDAVAAKVAKLLEKSTPQPEAIKPILDEMLVQLRHQNRAADMPEYSLARLVSMVVQLLAGVCVVMGAWGAVAALPARASNPEWYMQMQMLFRAGLWMMGAMVLQGFVIALYLQNRK